MKLFSQRASQFRKKLSMQRKADRSVVTLHHHQRRRSSQCHGSVHRRSAMDRNEHSMSTKQPTMNSVNHEQAPPSLRGSCNCGSVRRSRRRPKQRRVATAHYVAARKGPEPTTDSDQSQSGVTLRTRKAISGVIVLAECAVQDMRNRHPLGAD